MILNTENYNAQELQMFFNELKNKLHTKQAYSAITGLSAEGVRKRLKSVKAPQTYNLGGVVFVECDYEVQPKVEVEKLVLKKYVIPF